MRQALATTSRLVFPTSPRFVIGTSSADTLTGSAAPDIIHGKGGNDTLTGGGEADMFVVRSGEGSDVITDFQAGAGGDVLRLQGYGFADFQAVLAASAQSGADVGVALPGGETLTLRNVELGALTAANLELDRPLPSSGAPTNWS